MEESLCGFIELDGTSLEKYEVIFEDGEFSGVWNVNEGYIFDEINSFEEFLEQFGDIYYESLKDYKKDNAKSISKYFGIEK